jgi:hypothetical protein
MTSNLIGVRAKLARAQKHIDEFDAAFLAHPSIGTKIEMESMRKEAGNHEVAGAITSADLSPDITLAAGDAVHNLRSSLDHVICQLAIAAGNATACNGTTQFPVYAEGTPGNLKAMVRRISPISPDAQTVIRELQPYHRNQSDPLSDPLWILSELDNIDKHRLVLLARPHFTQMNLSVTIDDEKRTFAVSNNAKWTPLMFGTEPLRFRLTIPIDRTKPQTNVKVEAHPAVGVVFQQTGLRCDGRDVRTVLLELITEVTSIVDDFELRFFQHL